MKIFFRYLFMRLLQTFLIVLAACTVIWVMADLYGNMDDFLDHKVKMSLVFRFYILQIPKMLVQVIPATILFSALFTLLSLNRRSELVALQSGGMAPLWMFSPFFLFALIWMAILAYDMSGPASEAEVTRQRLLQQVKGQAVGRNTFLNLPYVDNVNHLIWYFQSLDIGRGKAKNMSVIQRDAQGHEMIQYLGQQGQWKNGAWHLTGVKKIVYAPSGDILEQRLYPDLILPEATTPPEQLSLIVSQPPQLTLHQLSQYLATSTQSQDYLAQYRTEWWNRVLAPFSVLVLLLFALMQGARTDRRGTMAGVGLAIIVLLGFTMCSSIFLSMGEHNRLPPFLAALATELIFGAVGLYLLAMNNGWWWQLVELWKGWYSSIADVEDDEEEADPQPPPAPHLS